MLRLQVASGSGYRNRRMPLVVKNWEGTEVSTVVAGFQHDLYLLDSALYGDECADDVHGDGCQNTKLCFWSSAWRLDANSDFTQIATNFVDRSGVVHPDAGQVALRTVRRSGTRSMGDRLCGEGCPWENAFGNAGGIFILAVGEPESCACAGAVAETVAGVPSGVPRKKCAGEV